MSVLERKDREKDNETGLKEGGRIEMSTTVLHRDARSFAWILTFLPPIVGGFACTGWYPDMFGSCRVETNVL